MNPETRIRLLPIFLVAALVLASCAPEQKTRVPVEKAAPPTDNVSPSPAGTGQTVLQETFTVKSSATFPFEIPAHAVRPHLHGIFASFVRDVHAASNDAANVDFLILSADQYADFVGNRPSAALFSIQATRNQSVNVDLPPSFDQPMKYYLIFRNAAGTAPAKSVEADFHVDF